MFDGKMKSGTNQFIMAAGKKAGNLPKMTKARDAAHPVKPMPGAGRPARARKKP